MQQNTIVALSNWPVVSDAFRDEVEACKKGFFTQVGTVPYCSDREMSRGEYMREYPGTIVEFTRPLPQPQTVRRTLPRR